jgi:acetamidase/formamidase
MPPSASMHHVIDRPQVRHRWNRDYPPVLTVASGDTVTLALRDSSDGQVRPDMSQEEFAAIDRLRIHALTGPVAVAGAEPGDALEIEFITYEHQGWAWTSVMPGLGALGDEITENFVHFWQLDGDQTRSMPGVTLDLHPFCGVFGVQRAEAGEFRTRPPGVFGGNMDVRHLGAGARLWLPVLVPGAGLCAGDAHAAQGDGEVSINGMEAPMTVTFRVRLQPGAAPVAPYALVPPPLLPPRYLTKPFHVFIESAEDPRAAAQAVVRRAATYLQHRLGLSRPRAIILCSVVLDLKVSQMVNGPIMTISGYLPEAIFDQPAPSHGPH